MLTRLPGYDVGWQRLVRVWGTEGARRLLPGLADGYHRERRHEDAVRALRALLDLPAPPDRRASRQWKLAAGLAGLRRDDEALDAVDRGLSLLRQPDLAEQTAAPRLVQLRDLAERTARSLLLRRHDELLAQALPRREPTTELRLMEGYLEQFPAAPQRFRVRMARADLLHGAGRASAAADAFEAVVDDASASELHAEAAKGAVLSLGELLATTTARPERASIAERLVARADAFLARRDGGGAAAPVRLERARSLRELGRVTEARVAYTELFRAGGKIGAEAAEGLLELLLAAEDWPALAATAAELRELPDLGGEAFAARMEALRCKATHRDLLGKGPTSPRGPRSGGPLLDFARDNPTCPEAPSALLAAALDLRGGGRLDLARGALETLLERHAEASEAAQARRELAGVCEALADLRCAADTMLRVAPGLTCAERSAVVLRAASFLRALGEAERALELVAGLCRTCLDEARPRAALFDAGLRALAQGDVPAARRHLGASRDLGALDPDLRLASRLAAEALAFTSGKQDTVDLELLLAEYIGSEAKGRASDQAATLALAELAATLRLRLEAAASRAARGELDALAELAERTAALERWAETARTAAGSVGDRARSLVLAADGLRAAAAAVDAGGRSRAELAADAARLGRDLRSRSRAFAGRALALGQTPSCWRRRALLLAAEDGVRHGLGALLAELVPGFGARSPFPGLPCALGVREQRRRGGRP